MNTSSERMPVEILLVEDNDADARLTTEALRHCGPASKVMHVHDGEEAVAFLRKQGRYEGVPAPDIILLDVNLPRKNGLEVLQDIKSDSALKHIPVVVLTVSADEKDVLEAYRLQANCYITKPINLDQFRKVLRSVEEFWLTVARLPHGED